MTAVEPSAAAVQAEMFSAVDHLIHAVRDAVFLEVIPRDRGAAMIDRLLDVRSEAVTLAPAPRRRKVSA